MNKTIYIDNNIYDELPNIQKGVIVLHCQNNLLSDVSNLPNTIKRLDCQHNYIQSLNILPKSLEIIRCHGNPLRSIEGIWKCKNLRHITFDQNSLEEEVNLFCKITGCRYNFVKDYER